MPRGYGSAESLLHNGLDETEWKRRLTPEQTDMVIRESCNILEARQPKAIVIGNNGNFSGNYRWSKERIYCSCTSKGLVLHELAHHIHYALEKCSHWEVHNERFAYWLDYLIYMWKCV